MLKSGEFHRYRTGEQGPPADLPEFLLRWPEFRERALALAERKAIEAAERDIVLWLVKLADRVGDRDLA